MGSRRSLHGGECDLLVDQFELHSQVYKKHQLALLEVSSTLARPTQPIIRLTDVFSQNCIYRVREHFNKEFDDVMRQKVNEIARIKEKNMRIAKILSQLKLSDPLVQPSLGVLEEPERLLVVEDSAVTVERYVSPEQEKRLKEMARADEEKLLAAMGDNPRERALDMMMAGRLEANVEEDLFKVLTCNSALQVACHMKSGCDLDK